MGARRARRSSGDARQQILDERTRARRYTTLHGGWGVGGLGGVKKTERVHGPRGRPRQFENRSGRCAARWIYTHIPPLCARCSGGRVVGGIRTATHAIANIAILAATSLRRIHTIRRPVCYRAVPAVTTGPGCGARACLAISKLPTPRCTRSMHTYRTLCARLDLGRRRSAC